MKYALLLTALLTTPCATAGPTILDSWNVIQARDGGSGRLTTSDRILQRLMYTDIELSFTDTSLRDVFDQIQEVTRCRLKPLWMSSSQADGLDPDMQITIPASRRPALDIIESVIEAISVYGEPATWQLRHSAFEISTKARLGARNQQILVTYPMLDLLVEIPDYNDAPTLNLGGGTGGGGGLGGGGGGGGGGGAGGAGPGDLGGTPMEERLNELIELIITMVEPDAWIRNGGTIAELRPWRNTLVIRAPRWIHRQIGDIRIPPPLKGMQQRGLHFSGSTVEVMLPS